MRFVYQLVHQAYKLRNKAVKAPSRFASFLGARSEPSYSGTHISLDFLYPQTSGHESLRQNYVIKAANLDFLSKYFLNFLVFQNTTDLRSDQRILTLPFKAFKARYRGVAALLDEMQLPHHVKLTQTILMRSFFQYLFIERFLITTYALVCASAHYERNISHMSFMYATLLSISQHDFKAETRQVEVVDASLPDDFASVLLRSEQVLHIAPNRVSKPHPAMDLPPLSAASLSARQEGLDRCMNPTNTNESCSNNTSYASTTPTVHASFHRYALSGRGLDNSLVTPVRGLLNKLYNKGRTPRNKQIYRTGVFWCLWLTIITIVGPFYTFYGFTFIYTHLYIFPLAILARGALVALARFFDITAKQLWLRFYHLF